MNPSLINSPSAPAATAREAGLIDEDLLSSGSTAITGDASVHEVVMLISSGFSYSF